MKHVEDEARRTKHPSYPLLSLALGHKSLQLCVVVKRGSLGMLISMHQEIGKLCISQYLIKPLGMLVRALGVGFRVYASG